MRTGKRIYMKSGWGVHSVGPHSIWSVSRNLLSLGRVFHFLVEHGRKDLQAISCRLSDSLSFPLCALPVGQGVTTRLVWQRCGQ